MGCQRQIGDKMGRRGEGGGEGGTTGIQISYGECASDASVCVCGGAFYHCLLDPGKDL